MNTTLLNFALAVIIFVGGFIIGHMTAPGEDPISNAVGQGLEATKSLTTSKSTEPDESGVAFVIDVSSLSDTQRAFLGTMGVSGSEIVVTNNMYACAQAEVGEARLMEIKAGAVPSMSEGVALLGCY